MKARLATTTTSESYERNPVERRALLWFGTNALYLQRRKQNQR